MKHRSKIAVLGGDLRQLAVVKELSRGELEIYAYGLCADIGDGEEITVCEDIKEALDGAVAAVLPLPVSVDDKALNCPCRKGEDRVTLDNIVELLSQGAILLGGRIPEGMVRRAQEKGIKVYDYFLSERLQIKNAYITAEAAVSIAMNSLDKCVKDARFAITGTGRISRLLADLLKRLGASVTVAARNTDSLAYYEVLGCEAVVISPRKEQRWSECLETGYDIIFNTVPSWIFDRDFLERVDKKAMIIELASAPGGVDICAARELSSNVLWASSLPGKYAPYSAGALIAECVKDILLSEGVSGI